MIWTRKLGVGVMGLAIGVAASGAEAGAQAARATVQGPRFEVDALWPRPLPNHWLLGSVAGIAIDARDQIHVLHLTSSFNARTETGANATPPIGECCLPAPAVLVFDTTGRLLRSWGAPGEIAEWPTANHGIAIDPAGNVWIGGSGGTDTRVLKFNPEGKLLLAVGRPAPAPAAAGRGAGPDTAYQGVAPAAGRGRGRGAAAPALPPNSASMEMFGGATAITFDRAANEAIIADGARNRRIVVVDMTTGAFKRAWGAGGNTPSDASLPSFTAASGQFGTPVPCVRRATDGTLYVCDPTHNRVQLFRNGRFVSQAIVAPATRGAGSVWDIAFSRDADQRWIYLADGQNMKVRVLDRRTMAEVTNFGTGGKQPGQFIALNGIATDSRGNVYTAEGSEGKRIQKFVYRGVGAVPRSQGVVWPARAAATGSRR